MGGTTPGDGVPGHIPLPVLDTVPAAAVDAHAVGGLVGIPVAHLQNHAGSGKHITSLCSPAPGTLELPLQDPPQTGGGPAAQGTMAMSSQGLPLGHEGAGIPKAQRCWCLSSELREDGRVSCVPTGHQPTCEIVSQDSRVGSQEPLSEAI